MIVQEIGINGFIASFKWCKIEKSHRGIKEREVEMKEFLQLFFVLSFCLKSHGRDAEETVLFSFIGSF